MVIYRLTSFTSYNVIAVQSEFVDIDTVQEERIYGQNGRYLWSF